MENAVSYDSSATWSRPNMSARPAAIGGKGDGVTIR